MLFLIISTPRPERPTEVAAARQKFWPWIAKYQSQGVCQQIYARVGRGAVAVFDVADNDMLHRILGEWSELVPAQFEIHPLVEGAAAQALLAQQKP